MRKLIYIAYLIGFVVLFLYLGHESHIDEQEKQRIYNENVCAWYDNQTGHPNYKQIKVDCDGIKFHKGNFTGT